MLSVSLYKQIVDQCLQIELDLATDLNSAQIDWSYAGPTVVDDVQTVRNALDSAAMGTWIALPVSDNILSNPTDNTRELRRCLIHAHHVALVIALPTHPEPDSKAAILLVQKQAERSGSHEPRTKRVHFFVVSDVQTAMLDLYAAYVRAGRPDAAQAYTVGKTDSSRHTAARRLLGNRLSALDLRIKAAAKSLLPADATSGQAALETLRPILREAQAQTDVLIDALVAEIERAHLKKAHGTPSPDGEQHDESRWEQQMRTVLAPFTILATENTNDGTAGMRSEDQHPHMVPPLFVVEAHWSVPVHADAVDTVWQQLVDRQTV